MSDKHASVAIIERNDTARVHPIVAQAMQRELDPQTLRELLEIQRTWEAGEAKRAYTRALVDLKKDLPTIIARDREVKFGNTRYTHASLARVMEVITGPLTMHGFSLAWEPGTSGDTVTVTCRLTHAGGHSESATVSGPVDKMGSKSPAQGVASTITLLSRYTALAVLGIATADMEEPGRAPLADKNGIDTAKNMRASAALIKAGISLDDVAEACGGRGPAEWIGADLDVIRAMLKKA